MSAHNKFTCSKQFKTQIGLPCECLLDMILLILSDCCGTNSCTITWKIFQKMVWRNFELNSPACIISNSIYSICSLILQRFIEKFFQYFSEKLLKTPAEFREMSQQIFIRGFFESIQGFNQGFHLKILHRFFIKIEISKELLLRFSRNYLRNLLKWWNDFLHFFFWKPCMYYFSYLFTSSFRFLRISCSEMFIQDFRKSFRDFFENRNEGF